MTHKRGAHVQIRTNAPDAYMILVITPVNVQSPIRGHVSAQMAARERAQQIQELQSQGFQKLYLLELPDSVMQVCHALPSSHSLQGCSLICHEEPFFDIHDRRGLCGVSSNPGLLAPPLSLKASQAPPLKTQCLICRVVKWAAMDIPHRRPRQIWLLSLTLSWPI